MTLKNTDDRWGAVSQLFHWVIVALILVMAYIGLTMGDLPNGPRKINIYALHKSIGLTILALVVLLMASVAPAPQGEGLAKDIGSGVGLHVIMLAAVTALSGLLGFALLPTLICHCN